jgi:hypothetical protein
MTADQQQHRDDAIRWIARQLEPRLVAGVDARDLAEHIVAAMVKDHWRCIPPAPAITAARTITPETAADTAHRGAQMARQALGLDRPTTT